MTVEELYNNLEEIIFDTEDSNIEVYLQVGEFESPLASIKTYTDNNAIILSSDS